MLLFEYFLWSGFLILPLNADISFGGRYCTVDTCDGFEEKYCESGCCTVQSVTSCCPNMMMVVVGTIFGTLLVVTVLGAVFIICKRRSRRKLHALKHAESLNKPQEAHASNPPVPSLPPDDIFNL